MEMENEFKDFFNEFFNAVRTLFCLKIESDSSFKLNLLQTLAVIKALGDTVTDMYHTLKTRLDAEDRIRLLIMSKNMLEFLDQIKDITCLSSIRFRIMSNSEIEGRLAPIPKEVLEKAPANMVIVDTRNFQSMFFSGLKDLKEATVENWNGEFGIEDVYVVGLKCSEILSGIVKSTNEREELPEDIQIMTLKKATIEVHFLKSLGLYYMYGN